MDLCILTFDGANAAEDALEETLSITGEGCPWLHEVGIVSRSAAGRLRITTSRSKKSGTPLDYEEGELALRAAALGDAGRWSAGATPGADAAFEQLLGVAAIQAHDVERRFFHTRALKSFLSCNSSALLLLAAAETCTAMLRLFAPYQPRVLLRHVPGKVADCLSSLEAADDGVDRLTKANEVH
jgi:hypothetical protein